MRGRHSATEPRASWPTTLVFGWCSFLDHRASVRWRDRALRAHGQLSKAALWLLAERNHQSQGAQVSREKACESLLPAPIASQTCCVVVGFHLFSVSLPLPPLPLPLSLSAVLGMDPRVPLMLGKCCPTELCLYLFSRNFEAEVLLRYQAGSNCGPPRQSLSAGFGTSRGCLVWSVPAAPPSPAQSQSSACSQQN